MLRGDDIDVLFVAENSADTYSLHFDHCPLHKLNSESCIVIGHKDIDLEGSLILCLFIRIIQVDSLLGPVNSVTMGL